MVPACRRVRLRVVLRLRAWMVRRPGWARTAVVRPKAWCAPLSGSATGLRPSFSCVDQHPAHVADVNHSEEPGVASDRQVTEMPGRHDLGRVTDTCGGDEGRACGHHGTDPDIVNVFAARNCVGNVCLGDNADGLAAVRIDHEKSGRACVLHQIRGRSHVIVLVDGRQRRPDDVCDGGRIGSQVKRRFLRGDAGHSLLHFGLLTCRMANHGVLVGVATFTRPLTESRPRVCRRLGGFRARGSVTAGAVAVLVCR
jgi:hypothetical protein